MDKLRGILLMKVDYNFLSKLLLGIRLIRTVESRIGFPEELGGGRKRYKTICIALNRKLVEYIMKQLRCPDIIT